MKSTLAKLTSKLSNDSSNLPASPNTPSNLPDRTAAVPTKLDKPKSSMVHSEKKFNIVVYGIEESPTETKKESLTQLTWPTVSYYITISHWFIYETSCSQGLL